MHSDVINRFLGTQDFARQTEVFVGRIECHPRETGEDDWGCYIKFSSTILPSKIKLRYLGRCGQWLLEISGSTVGMHLRV